jgi:hypothetical protein
MLNGTSPTHGLIAVLCNPGFQPVISVVLDIEKNCAGTTVVEAT